MTKTDKNEKINLDNIIKEIDEFKIILKNTDNRFNGKASHGKQLRLIFEDIDTIKFNLINYSLQLDGKELKTKKVKMRGGYKKSNNKTTKSNENNEKSNKNSEKSTSESDYLSEKHDKITDEINFDKIKIEKEIKRLENMKYNEPNSNKKMAIIKQINELESLKNIM